MNIFDHWKNLTSKTPSVDSTSPENLKSYSPYMINRFASMVDVMLPIAAEVAAHELPPEANYRVWNSILPKRYIKFNYMKKKHEGSDDMDAISEFFEMGTKDTQIAMDILTASEKQEIVKKFGGVKK